MEDTKPFLNPRWGVVLIVLGSLPESFRSLLVRVNKNREQMRARVLHAVRRARTNKLKWGVGFMDDGRFSSRGKVMFPF